LSVAKCEAGWGGVTPSEAPAPLSAAPPPYPAASGRRRASPGASTLPLQGRIRASVMESKCRGVLDTRRSLSSGPHSRDPVAGMTAVMCRLTLCYNITFVDGSHPFPRPRAPSRPQPRSGLAASGAAGSLVDPAHDGALTVGCSDRGQRRPMGHRMAGDEVSDGGTTAIP
jgi:hypothetical protein